MKKELIYVSEAQRDYYVMSGLAAILQIVYDSKYDEHNPLIADSEESIGSVLLVKKENYVKGIPVYYATADIVETKTDEFKFINLNTVARNELRKEKQELNVITRKTITELEALKSQQTGPTIKSLNAAINKNVWTAELYSFHVGFPYGHSSQSRGYYYDFTKTFEAWNMVKKDRIEVISFCQLAYSRHNIKEK